MGGRGGGIVLFVATCWRSIKRKQSDSCFLVNVKRCLQIKLLELVSEIACVFAEAVVEVEGMMLTCHARKKTNPGRESFSEFLPVFIKTTKD